MTKIDGSKGAGTSIFWGEIAPCEHIVQIYEDDQQFFDALTHYIVEGLNNNESVIVIPTAVHADILDDQLRKQSIDVEAARSSGQYVVCDVESILPKFMVNDWPDPALFEAAIMECLAPARAGRRRIRVFGEIVAVLWAQGKSAATINLEHLWHDLIEKEPLPLFCAYPKSGFTAGSADSLKEICEAHTKILGNGNERCRTISGPSEKFTAENMKASNPA